MTAKSINAVLAANLAHFMRACGIESQSDLAKRSGVAQRTISNYLNPDLREQGKSGKQPSAKLTEVEKIAQAMNIEAWDLLRDLNPNEREMYTRIETAYRELVGPTTASQAPGDRRRTEERRVIEPALPELRRNQLLNPTRGNKDRRSA